MSHKFHVLDDSYRFDPNLDDFGTGYESRDYDEYPMNGFEFCAAPTFKALSLKELVEIAKEKKAKKTRIIDKCDAAGLKVKNQSRSSYCWIHAPVHGQEIRYVLQGGKLKVLSAFWAGARIKNGRNQGGSGITGVKFLHDNGTCLEEMHKPMDFSVDRNPEHEANAKLHQITTWNDLDPQDRLLIATSVLVYERPVTVGIPAWSHEVAITFYEPTASGDDIDEGIDNSWGTSYGDNGRGILKGRYKRFDEAGSIGDLEPASA